MSILFDSARSVKSVRPFALGISASNERRMPYTAADLEWAAQNLNQSATDSDVEPDWDRMAGGFEAQARMDAGLSLF